MAASSGSSEVAKLQQHLDLLREQYVKLQQKHSELEQKYTRAIAVSGNVGTEHFVSQLLKLVSDLFDKPTYSDLTIILSDRTVCGHKFVLVSRSRHWNPKDETLSSTTELNLSEMTPFVALSMLRWVYSDTIVMPSDQDAIIELLAASNRYRLTALKEKCEQALIAVVAVRNCIKLYQTSEEHSAENLKNYCLQIISSHWNNLNTKDFAELSAPLLYDMFKAHTDYPLHLAIQHQREDVVFLFLIEYNSQLPHRLNECDNEGNIPLNLALLNRHEGIATTLVSHKCDLNSVDAEGSSLLHLSILRGDTFAASFLIKNGATTVLARCSTQEAPLHLVASYNPSKALTTVSAVSVSSAPWPSDSMCSVASLLLEYQANPDAQDSEGCTALHRAVQCGNMEVFSVLLNHKTLNLDLPNNAGESALWLALKQLEATYLMCDDISNYDNTFAARLIMRGASPDIVNPCTGNSLLHRAALECNEAAAVFLVQHQAQPNLKNVQGEAPIHISAKNGLHQLVQVLLQHGADPNIQTALKPRLATPLPSAATALPLVGPVPNFAHPEKKQPQSSSLSSLSKHHHPPSRLSTDFPGLFRQQSHHLSSPHQSLSGGGGEEGDGGMMPEFDFTSSSALGALSALSATSQALSGFGGVTSLEAGQSMSGYSVSSYGMKGRGDKEKLQRSNPFGSDSDEERYDVWDRESGQREVEGFGQSGGGGGGRGGYLPGAHQEVSGYHVTPLDSSSSRSYAAVGSDLDIPQGSMDSQNQQQSQASPLTKPGLQSPTFPLLSNMPYSPPTSPLGSQVREFIEPCVQFDPALDLGGRTALHLAIAHQHPQVVAILLSYSDSSSSGKLQIELNLNVQDSLEETALGLALWTEQFDIALQLLQMGADMKLQQSEGELGLLYTAIVREKPQACLFLLEHGADYKIRTADNETLLHLSIRHQLDAVVDRLCSMGVDLSISDKKGNSPLWMALRSRQETCASKLIVHGCDPNAWHRGSAGVTLTLLHRAILHLDEASACFLVRNGADVNSATRPGAASTDFFPPLHLACERGLTELVQCLIEHHANVNIKDSSGRTALHVSILCKQPRCSHFLLIHPSIDLTVRDKNGHTSFASALAVQDNEVGRAILQREPNAAEEVDSKGQNFLHLAILNQDVEAVIFLMSINVNVNSKVQNPTQNTPLHYAIKGGSEILARHLLLAGARVMDVDNHQRGVLHLAVEGDFSSVLNVLLENGADPDLMDEEGNTALHIACRLGHINCVQILFHDSDANLGAINNRGENCLHVLARYSKENAATIFALLVQTAPGFPIDKQDREGNTALLLAYFSGNTSLCDALIKEGAHPGMTNRQGVSIFNAPVATKQLLFRVLEQINHEPIWLEGNFCQSCNLKFNISHRKHHCRHCGRLLCKQCSSHQVPILKFDLNKAVRVCEICADSFVISVGGSH